MFTSPLNPLKSFYFIKFMDSVLIMDEKKISLKKDTDLIRNHTFDDCEKCDDDYSIGPNRTAISR